MTKFQTGISSSRANFRTNVEEPKEWFFSIFMIFHDIIIPKFLRLQFVSFLFLFFSEKSYDKSSRFYPLPSVPELFTPRSVIRNTYLEWIEVKRPRRNERSVFPFQLFLLRFKIIPPHNWRPHVRYVRWLGTDTRRRGKASWWKKVEFPYRSFTFFSMDRAPSNNARHVSASKKHYTAWIEGKHRISIGTYRLLDAKRACCAENTCDRPRSKQTNKCRIPSFPRYVSPFMLYPPVSPLRFFLL